MDTLLHQISHYEESETSTPERLILHSNDILTLHSGKYSVVKILGKGGFGSVYLIEELQNSQFFALKIMNLWEMQPSEFDFLMEKFTQGFKAGRLKSQNIVTSFSLGKISGNPYIIMEYCPNGNLEGSIHTYFNESQADELAIQILSGLETLHSNGIIHRDLKPANILFDKNKAAKLSDFDLSGHLNKRTTYKSLFGYAQAVYGTIAFCPPEQLDLGKYYQMTLPSMDMYAFGSTMYYVLSAGRNPYGDFSAQLKEIEKYQSRKKKEKPISITQFNPGISKRWQRLLEKCIEPDAKKRVQTVSEAFDLLELKNATPFLPENISGIAKLKVLLGDDIGKEFNLDHILQKQSSKLIRIGRESDGNNQIELTEKYTHYISRKHCVIEKTISQWILRDGQFSKENGAGKWQNSTNGTFVNHKKIDDQSFYILKNGDLIGIGDHVLKFNL